MVDGRDAAFTVYVLAHSQRVVRVAYLMCGNWASAEEITQIALGKLYAAWPRIESNPDGYLHRIVMRTVVDEHRRSWAREIPMSNDLGAEADQRTVVDGHLLPPGPSAKDGSELAAALLELPLRQRQTVILRHYWGLSVTEVTVALRISAGSVKSHTSRGLHRLHTLLNPPDPDLNIADNRPDDNQARKATRT